MMNTARTRATWAVMTATLLAATCAMAGGEYTKKQSAGEHFVAGVKYRPTIEPGRKTTARLYVVATDGWHMNEKFPYSVTLTVPDAVSAPKAKFVKADAVTFNDSKIVFKIPYSAEPGEHTLSAKVKHALCRKEQCVPHTTTLSWSVEVQGGQ